MLEEFSEDEVVISKSDYEWIKHFRKGRTSLEDDPGAGRGNEVVTLDYLLIHRFSAPADFLFPIFTGIIGIQSNVMVELKDIPKELFYRSFQDLYTCPQQCNIIYGDYFC
ncbi:hypothetical protein TNCV_2232491 [Trichonephila clavipes]|nr:hypothetical protein TNCV_2232491 [Trichonephila clavipes]